MILGLALTAAMTSLLHSCAPSVGTKTMAGIVQYESGWHPYAIGDNDTHRAYYPTSVDQAVSVATQLLRLGHNLDAGLGQVNSVNWAPYGLSVRSVFDACSNVRVGSQILAGNYASAMRQNWIGHTITSDQDAYTQQQYALVHALSSYNSGKFWASMNYADNVYAIASRVTLAEPTAFAGAIPPPGTPLLTFAAMGRPSSGHRLVRVATTLPTTQAGRAVSFRPSWIESRFASRPRAHRRAPQIKVDHS